MSIDDIHRLIDSKTNNNVKQHKSKRKQSVWLFFTGLCISLIVFVVILFPVLNGRNGWDVFQDWMSSRDKQIKNTSEKYIQPEPYLYEQFVKPKNSFGLDDTIFKHVNISFYRNWLNETIVWSLQKSVDNIHWVDADRLLIVKKDWDGINISEKHTLIIDSDTEAYYRLMLKTGYDKQLVSYEDKSKDSCYNMMFNVGEDDYYNISYNWSDFVKTSEYNKTLVDKQVVSDTGNRKSLEWVVYTSVMLGRGERFIIDPTFGIDPVTDPSDWYDLSLWGRFAGMAGTPGSSGTAYNITMFMSIINKDESVRFGIYDADDDTFIEETEEYTETEVTHSNFWLTLTLDSPVEVESGHTYILLGFADNTVYSKYQSGTGSYYRESATYPNWESPPGGGWDSESSLDVPIYCSYNVSSPWSNSPGVVTGEHPTNGTSTCVSVTPAPVVGCTIVDMNGNHTMNVTFASNATGGWVNYQTNSSVANNSGVNWTMTVATGGDTTYWWRVYVHDGFDNESFTFKFITCDNETFINIGDVNGNLSNTSHWVDFSYITGTITNSSNWVDFSYINGSISNTSIPDDTWQLVDDTTNGSITNNTNWVDFSYITGTITNSSNWVDFSYITGTITNSSNWVDFSYINGTVSNTSHWDNSLPSATGEHPTNGSEDIGFQIPVGCTINDADTNHTMNVTFATNNSGAVDGSIQSFSSTSDGIIQHYDVNWNTVHDAETGSNNLTSNEFYNLAISSQNYSVGSLYYIYRSFFMFDTSSIPDIATVTNVSLNVYGYNYTESNVVAMQGTQQDTLKNEDYDGFTGTDYGNTDWNKEQYNIIYFNQTGLDNINLTGNTKICLREYIYDYLDIPPPASENFRNGCYFANNANKKPYMNITYTVPGGGWVNMQTNSSVGDGTGVNWTFTEANVESTKYWWRVYVHDGFDNQSFTFHFTTKSNETIWTNLTDWNGNITNSSNWVDFQYLNGTVSNTSGAAWNIITDWNGNLTNTTSHKIISQDINGTITNNTNWVDWGYIDGTLTNNTHWVDFSYITGTITNSSNWVDFQYLNGTITNTSTSQWKTVDNSINGRLINYTGNATGAGDTYIVRRQGYSIGTLVAFGSMFMILLVAIPLLFKKRKKNKKGYDEEDYYY